MLEKVYKKLDSSKATNNRGISVYELLENYKELYKIEHCFRSMKSYLVTLRKLFLN